MNKTIRGELEEMDTEPNPDTDLIVQAGKWLKTVEQLSNSVGCPNVIEGSLSAFHHIRRNYVAISFVGGSNSGKSHLINTLLGRKLLPVSALAGHCEFLIKAAEADEEETVAFNGACFPLVELDENVSKQNEQFGSYEIVIFSQWLQDNAFELIEHKALDKSEDDIGKTTPGYREQGDIVVLAVDSLMPLKRTEILFSNECIRKSVPIIIVLTKLDQLPNGERGEVVDYVQGQLSSYGSEIPIVATRGSSSNHDGSIDLKNTISGILSEQQILEVRIRQFAYSLLDSLQIVHSAAESNLDSQKEIQSQKNQEMKRRQQEIDAQDLIWDQVEETLNGKRLEYEQQLRNHLNSDRESLLDLLCYELEKSNDIKTWWNRDLPYRLQRELRRLAGQLSTSINRQIASDLNWVREELQRKLVYQVNTSSDSSICLDETQSIQNELSLSDSHRFKIITRTGTAATVLMAGTLFATAGIGGAALAASVVLGLGAEQISRFNTSKDRKKVRVEISTMVDKSIYQYASDVSRTLKDEYDSLISKLKQEHLKWQQTQLQTLKTMQRRDKPDEIDWKHSLARVNDSVEEIKLYLQQTS